MVLLKGNFAYISGYSSLCCFTEAYAAEVHTSVKTGFRYGLEANLGSLVKEKYFVSWKFLPFFFLKGQLGSSLQGFFWGSLQHWVTFLTNSLDHCVSDSFWLWLQVMFVCREESSRICFVFQGTWSWSAVPGCQREGYTWAQTKENRKHVFYFLYWVMGLDFLTESESRHNPLAEIEKHSLYLNYRNKNCLKSSASCCWALTFYHLGCGRRALDVVHTVQGPGGDWPWYTLSLHLWHIHQKILLLQGL